jgi:26S proteasome regulatory subunit N1
MPDPEEKEGEAVALEVPTSTEEKKQTAEDKKKEKKEADELSEEDKALKEGLELAVTRLQEVEKSMHQQALDHLINEIRSATSSMTSVPKPLKFLRPHYDALKAVYQSWDDEYGIKQRLADVLSVLAMTMAAPGTRESLKFKLKGTLVDIASWGHEYVRSLAGEISEEYNARSLEAPAEDDVDVDDLMELVDDIVPFQMQHNAEADAVDLLMEVQKLNKLVEKPVVDERNYERVCLYLLRSADFVADPDDLSTLFNTAYTIYNAQKKHTDALRVALKMGDEDKVAEMFSDELAVEELTKKQMALILGRHRSSYVHEDEGLNDIIGNVALSERFLAVARSMDVLEPKTPEDIYKTHLADSRLGRNAGAVVDSARNNLASSFVNAFVNAGYCADKLMTVEGNNWVFKNKDHGMMSAAASLGMILLWNVDEGLNQIDKFFHNTEDHIKAGACLAVGILSSGVRNESDPALALLTEYVESSVRNIRISAVCGLGIAYAGAQREEVMELLVPIVANTEDADIHEVSMAALALGMTYVGTCNDEVGSVLVQRLMEATDDELNHTSSRFLCLGLGLLYLGKLENADAMLEAVRTVEHTRGKYAEITLETCAYAGTGDVLKVQNMLKICAEHLTENADHQMAAVLGIGLTVIGEDIGTDMCQRSFEHLLHYGELPVRRIVPLALALLYVSNPDAPIIDQLSRLSHDQDAALAQNAIFGLGLISAGCNNSRIHGLLRQLSEFYSREADHLFVVRLAQGLNSMGKGLIGLSPFHSDRLLMSGPALAGILTVLHACMDMQATLLDKYHYLLYFLTTAMNPRVLSTVDTDMNPVPATCRVGLAVETVGQAGRPKTITGFQTHTTPVLLGTKDRAELAGKEFTCVSSVVEGIVIVEPVPDTEMET